MIEFTLNKGIALIDNEDFESVNEFRWHINDSGYAISSAPFKGKNRNIRMHRLILGAKVGKYTDHINGNKLDNRRSNLRVCTNAQNMRNIPPKKQNSSGFKGVTWQVDILRWRAQIKVDYKNKYLGVFKVKEEAAKAYNKAAREYFGEFAWLNII